MKVTCELRLTELIFMSKDILEIVQYKYPLSKLHDNKIIVSEDLVLDIVKLSTGELVLSSIIDPNDLKPLTLLKHIASYTGGYYTPNEMSIVPKFIDPIKVFN